MKNPTKEFLKEYPREGQYIKAIVEVNESILNEMISFGHYFAEVMVVGDFVAADVIGPKKYTIPLDSLPVKQKPELEKALNVLNAFNGYTIEETERYIHYINNR